MGGLVACEGMGACGPVDNVLGARFSTGGKGAIEGAVSLGGPGM